MRRSKAARRSKTRIDASDIDEADRAIAGPSKKDRQVSENERVVAYHEAGSHTIVNTFCAVIIVPRGRAGGYMISYQRVIRCCHLKMS